ncbi:MAG: GntR family transcriptional regulator [Abditibacteriaceae bacterium]
MKSVKVPRKLPQEGIDFQLDDEATSPLYQQVQSVILRHIDEGRLQPGHRLPSVMQLSEEMGIAYATVARGVRALVEEGVLDARTSRGTLVAEPGARRTHHTGIFGSYPIASLLSETRYYRSLLFLIQETLVERGQTVVYNRWGETDGLLELLEHVRPVDSAVLFQVKPEQLEQVKCVIDKGTPLVCIGDTFLDPDVPSVHTTNRQDMSRLVRILRARGHLHIAALDIKQSASDFTADQRFTGFREAMSDLPSANSSVIQGSSLEQVEQLKALPQPPSAVICVAQRGMFRELFDALRGTQLELGKEVELAVWDENLWRQVEPLRIGYVGVEQPLKQIAELAVNELMRMLDEPFYRSGLIQVASQIVEVSDRGQRKVL